jgi:hypothetical protein
VADPSTARIQCHVASTRALRNRWDQPHFTSLRLFPIPTTKPPCTCNDTNRHLVTSIHTLKPNSPYRPVFCLHSCFFFCPSPPRLDSPRLHLSVEQSTQPPVTLVAQHLALTSLNSHHLRHGAPTFPPVWTNSLPHVATSPMHPHFSTTPFSIPPSHFPTNSTAPTYTSTQSSDNPLDLSARFYWSRRLATTCLVLHYRPFTNHDTPPPRHP